LKLRAAAFLLLLPAGFFPALVLTAGAWTFWRLEPSISRRLDQCWMAVSEKGREQYLLSGDEQFEVPYMASTLSVAAEPTRILDCEGRLIGEFSCEPGLYASDFPGCLKKALVDSEDGTFYRHRGINFRATARAMWVNLCRLRAAQGGSTLTQQLAKVLLTTRRKTFGRKVFEALCARKIESKFTKDQILAMYLNYAYFGHGAFGAEAASRFYFGKPARELDLAEAALLVGVIPSPNKYSPFENPDLARAKHRTVLKRMALRGDIPEDSVERIHSGFWREASSRLKPPEASFWRMNANNSPYLVETVRRALEKSHPKERILKGGLRVETTFDLAAQKEAEEALGSWLRQANAGNGRAARLEGGLAAVRPKDGSVVALVGGSGFNFSNQLNRSDGIRRPIGSTVKPFIYAAAFEAGRSPADRMADKPVEYRWGRGKVWKPRNFGGRFEGEVTLAKALRRSLNSVAVRLLDEVGVANAVSLLSKASGVPSESLPRNLTLALGTAELSPLQVACAYSVFVNGGRPVRPFFLLRVLDRQGRLIGGESSGGESPGEPVLSTAALSTARLAMQGVFLPDGTAHSAAARVGFSIPAAGKTGTTNDHRDAWFSGVTPDLSASVWVGHDDMRIPLADGGTGGGVAAPVWMTFVKAYYRDKPTMPFEGPALNEVEWGR
jgi:penicillin-binding protein 1A